MEEDLVKYYTCTSCGRTKPARAYARWGLVKALWVRLCGVQGCCDECLTRITRYPVHRPYPVVVVGDQTRGEWSDPPWRQSEPAA